MRGRIVRPTVALASLVAVACTAEAEVASVSEAVQYDYRVPGYYDVALEQPAALGDAVRATATVLVPDLDWNSDGVLEPVFAEDDTPIRLSCGVAFITPEHAITAAHCVSSEDVPDPSQPVTVQTYHLGPNTPWQIPKTLTGVFPSFHHPVLTAAQGYVTETHSCYVVRRCGSRWGPEIDCALDFADTALLHCPSAPACKTGYVDVAAEDDPTATPELVWAHEVYDVAASGDQHEHYTLYDPSNRAENYHYFGDGRNQLFPLISRRFLAGDIWIDHSKLGDDIDESEGEDPSQASIMWTDLGGCNGTSGSPVFQRNGNEHELLGPVSMENIAYGSGVLCIDPDDVEPMRQLLAYSLHQFTEIAAANACRRDEICEGTSGDPERFMPWLFCHRFVLDVLVQVPDWPWTWPCEGCGVWERFRLHDEPMIRIDRGASIAIPNQSVTAGATYRFSARIVPPATGASFVNVRLGATAVLTRARPTAFGSEHAGVVTGTFVAPTTGSFDLVITADLSSGGTLHATEIVLARNGATNGFDRYDLRSGVGLISASVESGHYVPMRFTGDGRGGYAADLRAGERMLVTRQALAAGRSYDIAFSGSRNQALTCRLVLASGSTVDGACNVVSGRASVRLTAPAGAAPVGLAIDMPVGVTPIVLDDLVIR
jgi:hypothetical protein